MKTRMIRIRTTIDEHEEVRAQADKKGLSMSDLLMSKAGVRKLPKKS